MAQLIDIRYFNVNGKIVIPFKVETHFEYNRNTIREKCIGHTVHFQEVEDNFVINKKEFAKTITEVFI